jgi:hypothetical protein
MLTLAALLAASQAPYAADPAELRWRRFVHAAVVTETPFSTRMRDLRRSVRLLPAVRVPRLPPIVAGPSGL